MKFDPASSQASGNAAASSSSGGDALKFDPASSQASGNADSRSGGGDELKFDPASSQASGSADPMQGVALVNIENSDDEVGDAPKYKLDCTNATDCGGYGLKWSEFLLVDPEASWAGKIWGWCLACSQTDVVLYPI